MAAIHAAAPKCRRVHPRLECKGIVRMRLLPFGSFADGALADLSIRGCCITLEPADGGETGSAVEVLLNVKGIALRLNGSIRHVSRSARMGIEFADVSPRKKKQIEELMSELLEMDKAAELERLTKQSPG
ncbi:MAG: PilZ domain-containing protein [Acidobacteriota bacterium]